MNLAVQLLHDAHLNRFDCAGNVSGDSDLVMPVKIVRNELQKVVGVLNPQRHPCAVLSRPVSGCQATPIGLKNGRKCVFSSSPCARTRMSLPA